MMTSADGRLLSEFLALNRELQRAPSTLRRLRSQGWTVMTLSTLTGLSIAEVTEILRGEPR